MISLKEIVEKYIRVPYKTGGTNPEEGLNCWNLVKFVLRDAGKPIEDIVDISEKYPVSEWNSLLENYNEAVEEIKVPRPFDIVLFNFYGHLHSGIVLNSVQFFHTCRSGTGICRFKDRFWKNKRLGFYRVRSDA